MSIKTGIYEISSALDSQFFIGRCLIEDRSLLPKRVVTLPKDGGKVHPWIVIKNEDDKTYTLKARDAPTAHIDGMLSAVLLDEPPATEWKITRALQAKDAYIVTTNNDELGWVVTKHELHHQLSVRPLIKGPSDPPFYAPTQVFIFRRLDEDEEQSTQLS